MAEPEPESSEDHALTGIPKLRACVCDVRDSKDGLCTACGGSIQPPNALDEHALQVVLSTEEGIPHERHALFSFGVVADVQYADLPVGTNFLKTVRRYYRHSLDALALAVQSWLQDTPEGAPVAFVAQLGDLIDGKNADNGQTAAAAADVYDVLSRLGSIPIHSAIGNHDVMNWRRAQLHATPASAAALVPAILSAPHLQALVQTPLSEYGTEDKTTDKGDYHAYRACTVAVADRI